MSLTRQLEVVHPVEHRIGSSVIVRPSFMMCSSTA